MVLSELGINPGEIALAEKIFLVEGDSDEEIYGVLLSKVSLSYLKTYTFINISGSGTTKPLENTLKRLEQVIHILHVIVLDGDQKKHDNGLSVRRIPYYDIEHILLCDPTAIFGVATDLLRTANTESLEKWKNEWSVNKVSEYIKKGNFEFNSWS